jgi:hypothetical protein
MNSASRHALSFLILSFILCFILLFIALYVYHDRSLRRDSPPPSLDFSSTESDPDRGGSDRTDSGSTGGIMGRSLEASYTERWISAEERGGLIFRSKLATRFALIHTLQLLPALIIFLFITAFTVFYTLSPFQTGSFQYHHVAIPSYFTLLAFIVLVILSEFLFIPNLFKESERITYQSRIVNAAYDRAMELKDRGDLEEARRVIEICLEIDETNRQARMLHDQVLEGLYAESFRKPEGNEPPEEPSGDAFLFNRGLEAKSRGDHYLALFYFERALSVRGEDPVIRRHYEEARREVDRLLGTLSQDSRAVQIYIRRKEQAIAAMERGGRNDLYDAYSIFSNLLRNETLQRNHPELIRDIELYNRTVQIELSKYDFHPSEIEDYLWLPSFDSIVFNDNGGFTNTVGRIATWNNRFYFIDIARYRIREGRIRRSQTLYGKWLGTRIRLKGLQGSRDFSKDITDYLRIPEGGEDLFYIETEVHPGYLLYLNEDDRLIRQLTVYERFSEHGVLRTSGFDIENPFRYLSEKIGLFFSVYVLSLVFAGIAWTKRSIYEFPPGFKLLLYLIIAPVLCYLFHLLFLDANSMIIYSHRYAVRLLGRSINMALYTGIINLGIAVIATVYYLSQRSSVE